MDQARRRFLRLSAIGALAASGLALGEAYPSRPIHWIVPFSPGGGTDAVARIVGEWLYRRLGQPLVVENRPGDGANIGTEAVVRAAADGYTLLLAASVNAINATLHRQLRFDFLRDMAPVAGLVRVPNVMVVPPSLPATTVSEFIAFAKANPGRINFGSAGTGTTQHVSGELFKIVAGVDMTHIPYRGSGPALTDLLGGRLQLLFIGPGSARKYVEEGRLRALAVTSASRCPALPDLPAVAELLPGFEATLFYGVCAPKGTSPAIVDRLNLEINAGLADPTVRARLDGLDGIVLGGSPAEFGTLVAEETTKWRKVIQLANIQAE